MNLKYKFYAPLLGLVLSIGLMTSCSKNSGEVVGTNTDEPTVPAGKRNLSLDFEVDGSSLSEDESRAFPIKTSTEAAKHRKPSVALVDGQTVKGHIFILRRTKGSSSDGDSNFLTILKNQTFNAKVDPTTKLLRTTVDITGATIKGYVNDTDAQQYDWYISVVFGGTWSGDKLIYDPFNVNNIFITKLVATSNPTTGEIISQSLQTKHTDGTTVDVPYGFGWQKFSFSNLSDLYSHKIKPLGYFVRFNFSDDLAVSTVGDAQKKGYQGRYRIYRIQATSSELFAKAQFNPSLEGSKINSGKVNWLNAASDPTNSNIVWDTQHVRSQIMYINKSADSPKQYFWLWFAAADASKAQSALKMSIYGEGPEMRSAAQYDFDIKLSPLAGHEEGSTTLRTLHIKSKEIGGGSGYDVHPMFWPAYGDVAGYSGNENVPTIEETDEYHNGDLSLVPSNFLNNMSNSNRAAVWFGGNRSDYKNGLLPNSNRYLPTLLDWYTFFPYSYWNATDATTHEIWYAGTNYRPWFKTSISGQSSTLPAMNRSTNATKNYGQGDVYTHTEYYKTEPGSGILYAIRFTNASNGYGNRFRSAWRYKYDGSGGIAVDIVQFGTRGIDNQTGIALPGEGQTSYDVNFIANEDWWKTAKSQGRAISHYFAIGPVDGYTGAAIYMTSTVYTRSRPTYMILDINGFAGYVQGVTLTGIRNRITYHNLKHSKVRYFKFDPEKD